jgi:transcriptional regulator with XRE-family HTH domain
MEKNTSQQEQPTLKQLREVAELTQEQLSSRVKVAKSTLAYWEWGQKIPRVDKFFALARELNVPPIVLARAMNIDVSGVPFDSPDQYEPKI